MQQDEKDADNWSRDNLISAELFKHFEDQKNFDASSIIAFASDVGIAPGIVVGRLQNE